ncbi:MAG: hypothetical protein KJ799_17695 [Bacteroidetes bacterium]|nr:hypothetical protein [Bacteroidota bacterium]
MALNIPEKPVGTQYRQDEQKKDGRGLRVNYPIIILSGLVILFTALIVFLLIIRNVYGEFDIEEILPTKENLSKLGTKDKVAILYSQNTENTIDPGSTWLSDNVNAWENFLTINRRSFIHLSDQDIELGNHFKYKLLILPGSKSLSDREIIQLKKYLDLGGSVFATGGTASFSDEAKWRGWEFFIEVFGLVFTKEIDPNEKTKVHTLRGNLPLTAEIPTGYTLKIATWDRPIYTEILEPRTTQASFWYDHRKEAGLVREEVDKSAGIAYGTYGKGRFVWFGFELTSVIGEQEDYINFEKLVRNSIAWLSYAPTGFVKDWPDPYKAAAIFIPTISNSPQNILNLSKSLGNVNFPATYFIDPFVAMDNRKLIKNLGRSNPIGGIVDIGFLESSLDTVNSLFDKNLQYSTIAFAQDTLQRMAEGNVKGIMPFYGFYNENTLQAMKNLGLEFIITDSLTDRSVPEIAIRDGKSILVITKTGRDDYEIIREYGLTNPDFQRYTYEEDIDRVLFEGGLYVLKVHTDYQLQSQYVHVIKDIASYLRKKDIWIVSIDELMNWWKKKGGLEIRYTTRSERRIAIEISNPKENIATDFVVQVDLNKPVKNIKISADIINTTIPEHEFDGNTNTLYLFIKDIEPDETYLYLVDFENVEY